MISKIKTKDILVSSKVLINEIKLYYHIPKKCLMSENSPNNTVGESCKHSLVISLYMVTFDGVY